MSIIIFNDCGTGGTGEMSHRGIMARVNIPRSEYGVLKDIAELPELSFSELLKGMSEIEPTVSQIDISGPLSKKVPSINIADLKTFLRTLFSLYRIMEVKERSEMDPEFRTVS